MHHNTTDGDGTCLILFAGNIMLNATSYVHKMMLGITYQSIINGLQALALIASIVASVYVAIDHHKKIKWKKRQEATVPHEHAKKK